MEKFKVRLNCEVCNNILGKPLIDLPNLPLTECLFDEPTELENYNQEFHLCEKCGHGQLGVMLNPKILYNDYFYKTSSGGNKKTNDIIVEYLKDSPKFDNIIDIGCNDLYLLKALKNKSKNLIGIEPSMKYEDKKIKVINKYVEDISWKKYINGRTLITSIHNLEHIEHPRELIEKMFKYATDDTLFIFEFPCFEKLIEHNRFDQIFHHHLHYFSLDSFRYMLNEIGGEIHEHQYVEGNWGALRVVFGKKLLIDKKIIKNKYKQFQEMMKQKIIEIKNLDKNTMLVGYGAVLTLPVLDYHLKNILNKCQYITDIDSNKKYKFFPNLEPEILCNYPASIYSNAVITGIGFNDIIKKDIKKTIKGKIIELK